MTYNTWLEPGKDTEGWHILHEDATECPEGCKVHTWNAQQPVDANGVPLETIIY